MPEADSSFQLIERVRADAPTELTDEEKVIAKRVWAAIAEVIVREGGPTLAIGTMLDETKHIAGTAQLLEELDIADRWAFATDRGEEFMAWGVRRLLIIRFLHSVVDHGGWYTARWYDDVFGIPATRLRQAAFTERLASRGKGQATVYPLEGVARLWPQDVPPEYRKKR